MGKPLAGRGIIMQRHIVCRQKTTPLYPKEISLEFGVGSRLKSASWDRQPQEKQEHSYQYTCLSPHANLHFSNVTLSHTIGIFRLQW